MEDLSIKQGKSIEKIKVAVMKKTRYIKKKQDWFRILGAFFVGLLRKFEMTKKRNIPLPPSQHPLAPVSSLRKETH